MEELTTFLTAESGRVLYFFLLLTGITNILIIKVIFGIKLEKLEKSILPSMTPDEKERIGKKIKSLKEQVVSVQLFSIAVIAFTVFGLTR